MLSSPYERMKIYTYMYGKRQVLDVSKLLLSEIRIAYVGLAFTRSFDSLQLKVLFN